MKDKNNIKKVKKPQEIQSNSEVELCEHEVKVLTKEEVEANRSNAYKYLDL